MGGDGVVCLLGLAALMPIVYIHRNIGRFEGIIMALLYVGYLCLVFEIGHDMYEGGF